MRITTPMLLYLCLATLIAGCRTDPVPDTRSGDPAGQAVIYPSGRAIKFPEDQVIKKKIKVTTQWQTIVFDKPLKINREGLMGLHLAVIKYPYISTIDDDPRNLDCSDAEYQRNAFSLRRISDWALVRPEAILAGDNGVEVNIRPDGHLHPFFDKNIITIALRTFKDVNSPSPPFPEGIKAFTAMRIRSTEPFTVQYLWWSVDRHPEIFFR